MGLKGSIKFKRDDMHRIAGLYENICETLIDADVLCVGRKEDGGEVTYSWELKGPSRKKFHVIDRETGKEADTYNIALHENWAKGLVYCDMEGWAIENDGTLLLVDECGKFAYADRERFKVVWDA